MSDALYERYVQAVNRLGKWRSVFAGWQLGTRSDTDPEARAVRDQFDRTIMLRAEVNALTALLIAKGLFTVDEFRTQIIEECGHMERMLEEKFPGFKADDHGMVIDIQQAAETMKGWRP